MKRIAPIVAALLLFSATASAQDWRPAPTDRLAAMDAEMAPLLAQYQPTMDAIVQDFTTLSVGYMFTTLAEAADFAKAKMDAASHLEADVAAALTLAHDALAVLDRWPPDHCWSDYAAVLRSGWLLYGDAAADLQQAQMDEANGYIGIALRLLGPYGELVHTQAQKDCA